MNRTLLELFPGEQPEQHSTVSAPAVESFTASEQNALILLDPRMLEPFGDHPFRLYTEEKLEELADSIRQHGVLNPLVVRPLGPERYEILSGHNRCNAALAVELPQVPCIVRNASDDEAVIIVTDSNLQQREELLPSEKAYAYKMKLEAIKRQGCRENGTSSQVGTKFRSNAIVADSEGESSTQIARYIRLTFLLRPLLDRVDSKELAFNAAVELSYLKPEEQEMVLRFFFLEQRGKLDIKTAQWLRRCAAEKELTERELERLTGERKAQVRQTKISIPVKQVRKYIPPGSPKEQREYIVKALEHYMEYRKEADETG